MPALAAIATLPLRPSPHGGRQLSRNRAPRLAVVGLTAWLWALSWAPPVLADELEDDQPEPAEVCTPAGSASAAAEGAGAGAGVAIPASASTEDLYDLRLFADLSPEFKVVADAWRKRQWLSLVQRAADLIDKPPAGPSSQIQAMSQAALMMQALGHEGLRQWAEAERVWQRLAQKGPLAQRARQHLADLALRRRDVAEALAQLAAVPAWHVARDASTLAMAQLELDRGQVGPAADALERLRPNLLSREQAAHYGFLRGEVARRSGKLADARHFLEEAWNSDAEPFAQRAGKRLAEMDAAPSSADQIERILRRRSGQVEKIRAWLREAEAVTEEGSGLRLYVQGALWMRDRKTRDQAPGVLAKAVELLEDPLLKARAVFALGDALGRVGDDKGAIETLGKVAPLLAGLTTTAAADVHARTLARLHRLYNNVDRPSDAEQVLQRLLDLHPDADERELAVWGLGWQRFLAGNWAKSLELFVKLEREHGHLWTGAQQPWRAKAVYWQGRALQHMGQTEAALEAWASVANTYPQTYYGIVSLDRIREIDADRAARLQGPPPSPVAADVPPPSLDRLRVSRHQALEEAVLLVRAGMGSEARWLLSQQISRGLPRDGVHLLSTLYEIDGQRRQAYGVMSRHTRRAARPDDSTAQMWRQSFPRAFAEEAVSASQTAGISRSLLYAIMRHESAFVPTAVSKAGAYGLVQLLPGSAKNVSELHKLPYAGPASLLRPQINLAIGAHYLAQMLSFYRGNLQVTAAAYNAGPYAARDWVKRWQHLPTDAFVENIPYPATRAYVMQVSASAQTYAWLYPEWQELAADKVARAPLLPQAFGPFMQRQAAQQAALVN